MVDVDEQQASKRGRSGSSSGGVGTVQQEYQYDADLEPSYWKSLLRAAGKTLGDGLHPLVLLDAPALRAEQVREVWKVAQGAGAELLVVNPLTTDPEVRGGGGGGGGALLGVFEGWLGRVVVIVECDLAGCGAGAHFPVGGSVRQ
jgi:hypothetical protein